MSSFARSRVNTFGALDIDRNADQRDDAEWLAARRNDAATRFLLLRDDGHAFVDIERRALRALDPDERARLRTLADDSAYLGRVDNVNWFAVTAPVAASEAIASEINGVFLDLRGAALMLASRDAGLFAYARAIANWQRRMRFCNVCAAPLTFVSAGHRAKCTNSQCNTEHFPRTDAAIIVIVTRGDACLLGRGPGWPAKRYSTLAGFVEPGETLEDTVRREVFEEAGVRVVDCDYHSSQPWPFPASIMLGFTASADEATIRLGNELEDARWFTAEDIADGLKSGELLLSPPLSISYRLIEQWMAARGVDLAPLVSADAGPWASRR